jgi:uncharacterized protein DUF6745
VKTASEARADWLTQLLSTAPADRPRAEAAVRGLYRAAGFAEPKHFFWFDSPFAATWAVALFVQKSYHLWNLPSVSRDDRQRLDQARLALGTQLGTTELNQMRAAVGVPRVGTLLPFPDAKYLFSTALLNARYGLVDDLSVLFHVYGDDDDLARAENFFWGGNRGALRSALHCPTTDSLIGNSFFSEYSFSHMADDAYLVGDREPAPVLHAAWETGRSTGLWWPFEHAAIMSDRPSEVHVNERHLLHRGDGPAAVFRDGWKVYAWNGKAVPERWIMSPEAIPARELKGFDATFRKYVESRVGPPSKAKPKGAKSGSILAAALPTDSMARLERLRAHAGGRLPLFDRYQAGEHEQVWHDLVALGPDVRADPHVADALAVAYETMRRVETNVRTVVERLMTMGYTFTTEAARADEVIERAEGLSRIDLDQLLRDSGSSPQLGGLFDIVSRMRDVLAGQVSKAKQQPRDTTVRAHVPPAPNARKQIVDFEKRIGVLPLSLRVFYEVVGEVDLIGHHPTLAPRNGTVAPDPLVVYGLDERAVDYDEDEDGASVITIAPDDLHKADTSGGDPYEMAIPDLRADGELLNERHHLFFVDYLRLCFKFGGFPGYDGIEDAPAEIATLNGGLVEF